MLWINFWTNFMTGLLLPSRRRACTHSARRNYFPHRMFGAALLTLIAMTASAQAPPVPNPPFPGSRFVVVLDAAHGGGDAGAKLTDASGNAEAEKDYTLAFNVQLRSLLAARGIGVVTTRESDVALTPEQRAEIADHARAQACLSLHASMNGLGNGSGSGSSVHLFLSSLPPARAATFLPWRTAQAAWVQHSIALAGVLNSALVHAGLKVTIGRTALTTIDSMACPAVAVELAPAPAAQSSNGTGGADYQTQVADALAAGLLEWRAGGEQP